LIGSEILMWVMEISDKKENKSLYHLFIVYLSKYDLGGLVLFDHIYISRFRFFFLNLLLSHKTF
jgi:hypothetical protein